MPRVGAVEGFVAQREVGDDVALDDCFEQRPLEPRRVAQPAMPDTASSIQPYPAEDVTAEAFDQRKSLAGTAGERCAKRTGGQMVENLIEQIKALFNLANANPDAGGDIALRKNRDYERQRVIWRGGRGVSPGGKPPPR